jgi:hypothetical protein
MVFSEQRMADLLDPHRLLKVIHDDMEIKSQSKLKATFIEAIDLIRRIPWLLTGMTRSSTCFSTGVISNVGVVLENTPLPRNQGNIIAGDVVVQGIDGVPPIRPGTQIAFCVCTYNDRMSMTLNSDPRYFSADQSRRFLEKMRMQMRSSFITGSAAED